MFGNKKLATAIGNAYRDFVMYKQPLDHAVAELKALMEQDAEVKASVPVEYERAKSVLTRRSPVTAVIEAFTLQFLGQVLDRKS